MTYADTSFLVSWHLADVNFPSALALQAAAPAIVWSPWQQVEFNNAVRALVFRKIITPGDVTQVLASVAAAVSAGDLRPAALPENSLWTEAERLSQAHTPQLGTRTLDLLHVAAARVLKCRRFLTFDQRQAALARAAGFQLS